MLVLEFVEYMSSASVDNEKSHDFTCLVYTLPGTAQPARSKAHSVLYNFHKRTNANKSPPVLLELSRLILDQDHVI